MTEALKALAANVVSRHKAGVVDPYILFIGAGASITSGCSSMLTLAEDLLRSHDSVQMSFWDAEVAEAEKLSSAFGELQRREISDKKVTLFLDLWGTIDSETRFAFLRKHLFEGKTPSQGYLDLAYLVKSKFFTTILTTNLDTLIEKALQRVGLLQPEDFIVVVNKKDSSTEVADQLENSRAPIRIVKLHGTLESPLSYAFTPDEIFSFEKSIRPSLTRILNQSLIIVGHSMQDRDINILFEADGKEIHFVNPVAPKRGSSIDNILTVRGVGSTISGPSGYFDNFFGELRRQVETLSTENLGAESGSSIESFLRSIGLEAELRAPRSRYKNLQTLYVKPTEYDDILEKLENDHLVFIIGEPHMGKTYTALYILWEYHQKGYETIHIRHDKLIHLLHQHDDDLKELLLDLFKPKNERPRIIHFDDPFGETSERRTEVLASQLDVFLEMVKSYEHLRVVVTSRLNIFNEALAQNSAETDVEALEKTLRVHTSYSREVLLEILHRYVNFHKPAWAYDEKIVAELDEKLPSMLPAPHNIEFFVRTSEKLTSLETVLAHVEESKMIINALASWMRHMSPHEQIFLVWIEVCSTASILFPGTPASEIEIEKVYNKNLGYLFSEGYLPGIPFVPFASARDKFETILLERLDERSEEVRIDFVHPSYHEAFWYAVNRRYPMAQWWEFLSKNLSNILRDVPHGLDLVQLKMIERYGTINRNLDQLLLLSSESDDPYEQLMALEHMLDRAEQFATLPQFAACVTSLVSQEKPAIRSDFLDLYDRYFEQLPLDVLRVSLTLLFDDDRQVRIKAEKLIGPKLDALPQTLDEEMPLQQLTVLTKLIPYTDRFVSRIDSLEFLNTQNPNRKPLLDQITRLSPPEIEALARIRIATGQRALSNMFYEVWEEFSTEQKQAIALSANLKEHTILRNIVEDFIDKHLKDLVHLRDRYPVVRDLEKLRVAFGLKSKRTKDAFKWLPIAKWPAVPDTVIRELSATSSLGLGDLVTERILEGYEDLPAQNKDRYLEALYSPSCVQPLIEYLKIYRGDSLSESYRKYPKLSESILIRLLNAEGRVQYEVLTSLVLRFDELSHEARQLVNQMIISPPDWWVGGSIGQLCQAKLGGRLSKSVENLPSRLLNLNQKRLSGAMLSELIQYSFDGDFGIQEKYKPLIQVLGRDPEIVHYAKNWMDHSLEVFNFYSKEYWVDKKSRMQSLFSHAAT